MPKKRAGKETPVIPVKRPRSTGAKTGMIRARVSPELKAEAESILARIGLSSSDAIRMFYSQVAMRKGLPFEARIPNATADLDAWFKELDRFAAVPFMEDGRRQPPMPKAEDLFE
jgi:addiction module RelB/DinJ family antitoxin